MTESSSEKRPVKASPETKQPKDFYVPLYKLSRLAIRRTYEIHVEGRANVLDEPAVYAGNHIAFADSLIMSVIHTDITKQPMRFVVKKEYHDGKGLDDEGKYGKTVKWFMQHALTIPVDREANDASSAINMVRQSKAAAKRGESIGIHPPSTRVDEVDGLPRFSDGASLIAVSAGIPAVGTAIRYGEKSESKDGKRVPVYVTYSKPVYPSEFATLPDIDAIDTPLEEGEVHPGKPILTSKQKINRLTNILEHNVAQSLNIVRTGVKAELRKHRKHSDESE